MGRVWLENAHGRNIALGSKSLYLRAEVLGFKFVLVLRASQLHEEVKEKLSHATLLHAHVRPAVVLLGNGLILTSWFKKGKLVFSNHHCRNDWVTCLFVAYIQDFIKCLRCVDLTLLSACRADMAVGLLCDVDNEDCCVPRLQQGPGYDCTILLNDK